MSRDRSPKSTQQLSCQDKIVLVTLPFIMMLSSYDSFGLGGLLPLIQPYFNINDSEAAIIKTFNEVAHGIGFSAMWLIGDFLPKKTAFLSSIFLWIIFHFASIIVSSEQFWLFVILRSLASVSVEIFRILVTVIQAEYFTGNYLAGAITANIVGESFARLLSPTVNSIFVANQSGWQLGTVIGPTLSIPLLITYVIFIRKSTTVALTDPKSILRNAFGVLRIPSYLTLIVSQCVTMFYSNSLFFWMPSLTLDAFEAHSDTFLGLSYPAVSSLIASATFAGMMVGAFGIPWLNYSLASGSGLCRCFSPTSLALAIVYAASSLFETLSYITQVTMITANFPIFVVSFFVDGIAGGGIALNNLQIVIATTPANQRASALSLLRLMISLGTIPSAQVIGFISDYFHGDSTSPSDKLAGLQTAFLYTWVMPLVSTVMCFIMLRFYKKDLERAKQVNQRDEEETSPLISAN